MCGKAARWWDGEIRLMRQISSGMEDKWGEYYKLCLEIKGLVCKKGWNEVIEKVFFYENSKEFWAFVGRISKGNRCFLRSTSSSCITNTKGKLEVLHEHYEKWVQQL